jgi:hypothetical protein
MRAHACLCVRVSVTFGSNFSCRSLTSYNHSDLPPDTHPCSLPSYSTIGTSQYAEHALYESRPNLQDPSLLALAKSPSELRSQVTDCDDCGKWTVFFLTFRWHLDARLLFSCAIVTESCVSVNACSTRPGYGDGTAFNPYGIRGRESLIW